MTDGETRPPLPRPIEAERLRVRIDPEAIGFDTTADSPDLEGVVGQSRACEAIEFGAGMPGDGFNIFALGPWGAGRRSTDRKSVV